ncbi:MAG: TM0106 family RecB-like putative nuclease [Acidimicrobiaceae bacterium]|nr:TM0106 family RecB-like putative nuclease [Acidimicrobiaceae bacterium]
MAERLLTPSKITAWLDCAHFLTLRHEVDSGVREPAPNMFGEMAEMLLQKGLDHEQAVLEQYREAGRDVFVVPDREKHESFAQWVARAGDVLGRGHEVVFQMPFIHDGIRGIADFLERVVDKDGNVTYEPVDAKLARNAAKPGHVLQLCFYAEAIAAQTGHLPEYVHIELGSGVRDTVRVNDVLAYWRRLRGQLARLVDEPPAEATTPEPCDHCGFCEFELVCDSEWRAADSLVHVAGVRRADRALLQTADVDTIAGLAALESEVDEVDANRLARMVRQATLQVEARNAPSGDHPPFELLDPPAPVAADLADLDVEPVEPELTGFAALPAPDDGDVFLDYEGHPFWKADVGLFFLFGFIERSDEGAWGFKAFWAHDQPEEKQATQDLVDYLAERRTRFPNMHVYHYNHTERTSLVRLAVDYGVAELELERQIDTGLFVDLFPIVTGAMQVGVESYGLKYIEQLTDYERSHDIDQGAGAVVEYEHWTKDHNQARLDRIARYNEDDVRATMAVRDWLIDHRPDDVDWRDAVLEPEVDDEELDARIEALHAFGPGTDEHLMGDLLGYWRRERKVVSADCLRLSMADEHDQIESLGAIARLTFEGFEPRFTKNGNERKWPVAVFSYPPQPLDPDIKKGAKMILALQEKKWAFFSLAAVDRDAGTIEVSWNQKMIDQGVFPTSLAHNNWFREAPKPEALCALADQMLAGDATSVGHAMLRNESARFHPGEGPADGIFVGGYKQVCEWAPHLDRSFVPIQGPPGTGKTFTGAHVIHTLVKAGKRVGVTAMSHPAIDNLMEAVVERFAQEGDELRAVRKAKKGSVSGVEYIDDNPKCATGPYDVIAGTSWLFANQAMRDNPVDVLVVDEAGQLGLADTLAATVSTENVILLGDPQQLPQVSQASHPNGSGASALEHLLGEGVRTFPPERGVLLDVTWRMHPDVCDFISEVMYEGKLSSEPSCSNQSTSAGTGLRWIRAEHDGHATESPEEVQIVIDTIAGLVGTDWTDQAGATRPLTSGDFIVVTPYNDQRRLIGAALETHPATAGVEVGTVDKFQGREAAVVLFSMATSSAEFMPRTADFLFSKNRLNVAISRARCLAYLICTDELLDTRARTVEEMELISALCSFVERAQSV